MHRGLHLPIPADAPTLGPDAPPPPTRVILTDVDGLLPPNLNPSDVTAWLKAPVAGLPLYRRLLEMLESIPTVAMEVCGAKGARALGDLLANEVSCPVNQVATAEEVAVVLEPLTTLLLPAAGLPVFDAISLLSLSRGTGRMRWVALAELEGAAHRTAAVALPPGVLHFEELLEHPSPDAAISVARNANCALALETGGHLYPTHSATMLRRTAQLCLDGDLLAAGLSDQVDQPVIVGQAVTIGSEARIFGPVAIGDGCRIDAGAVLGPGTVLGRHCHVGERAIIEDVVVLDGGVVAPGESLSGLVRTPRRDLT